MDGKLFDFVDKAINKEAHFLNEISQEIWKNPELKLEENFAHDLLTSALEKKGFTVERKYILPTAFRAEFSGRRKGPAVIVICEYDALPQIGHACGHNLIAEAGLAAGIAIKGALEAFPEISGKVIVLGTPAEEGGCGKVILMNGGAFKDVDAALMVHPAAGDHMYPPFIGIRQKLVTFTGQEAHASGYPWEGLNALDGAVGAYNNISLLRQHIKPTCRVHCIITKGGEAANIIPGHTEMVILYRAAMTYDLNNLGKRVDACVTSAAVATGCQVNIHNNTDVEGKSLITNKVLAERYKIYAEKLGVQFDDGNPKVIPFMASSDMGDVSHAVPSIHPTYSIETSACNHSVGFTKASAAPEAQETTLIAAKSMAMVALDLMCDKDLLQETKDQFQRDLAEDSGI